MPATDDLDSGAASSGLTDVLAIVVAWNFAVAQPVLDVLGRNSPFFTAHSAEPVDVVLLALGLAVVAPLVVGLAVWGLGRLWRPAGVVAHGVVLGVLAGLFGWVVVKRFGVPPFVARWALMAAVGLGAVVAYRRWPAARSFARWLSPAPVVFLVLFLFFTPVADVVRPAGAARVSTAAVRNPVPVVVVVFDELPAVSLMDAGGRIDAAAFPNFARLASMSTWYRNTTTVHDETIGAVPAILDGRYPTDGMELPTSTAHPENLFTVLGGTYDIDAYEALTYLCPPGLCGDPGAGVPFRERMRSLVNDTRVVAAHAVLPPSLARRFPALDLAWADFGTGTSDAETVVRAWGRALEQQPAGAARRRELARRDPAGAVAAFGAGLRPTRRPVLHFLHVEIPHSPWRFLPSGQVYPGDDTGPTTGDRTWSSQAVADQNRARHLLQTAFADRLLGEMLDRMESTGLLDRALVVVTADHGVAFRSGQPMRTASAGNVGEVAWVPFFVKEPGQRRAAVDDRPAETIDLLPTVADVVGTPAGDADGRSLLGRADPHRRRTIMATSLGRVLARRTLPPGTGPMEDALRRKVRVIADDPDDLQRFYRIGRDGALVGTLVPRSAPASGVSITSPQRQEFDDLDPRGPRLPVLMRGSLGPVASGGDRTVRGVIAVDGTIAGTIVIRAPSGSRAQFFALLDPSTFRTGPNRIDAYLVSGPPDRPRFARMAWR